MEPQVTEQPKKGGKAWVIFFIVVIVVCVAFLLWNSNTEAPATMPQTGSNPTTIQEADNTDSIQNSLNNLQFGNISEEFKGIDADISRAQ